MKNGTPGCSAAGCAAGTMIAGVMFETANSVWFGTVVAPGDSWSLIGCPGPGASAGFAPSPITTVVFGL